jgi:hypothetical protein
LRALLSASQAERINSPSLLSTGVGPQNSRLVTQPFLSLATHCRVVGRYIIRQKICSPSGYTRFVCDELMAFLLKNELKA